MLEKLTVNSSEAAKTRKKLVGIVLAAAMAVAPLTFSACAPKPDAENPNPGIEINDGTYKYSQILQDVLKSDYYNSLTEQHIKNHWMFSNKIGAIPYSFLEQQGIDIDKIKNDQQKCITSAYVENENKNDLIVNVRVEESFGGNYYSCFKLKYTLTDKEYEDMYMLHKGRYIQAPYFIQRLTTVKTPTVLSDTKVDVETLDKLENLFNNLDYPQYFNNKKLKINITNITGVNNISLEMRSTYSNEDMITNNGIKRDMDFYVYEDSIPSITNGVYKIKTINIQCMMPTNVEEFKNNYTAITYFTSQNLYNINMDLRYELNKEVTP